MEWFKNLLLTGGKTRSQTQTFSLAPTWWVSIPYWWNINSDGPVMWSEWKTLVFQNSSSLVNCDLGKGHVVLLRNASRILWKLLSNASMLIQRTGNCKRDSWRSTIANSALSYEAKRILQAESKRRERKSRIAMTLAFVVLFIVGSSHTWETEHLKSVFLDLSPLRHSSSMVSLRGLSLVPRSLLITLTLSVRLSANTPSNITYMRMMSNYSWPLTQTSLVIQLAHCSNSSVVWRSCRHGWLLTSWWWTLIKQSSSSHLLLLTISTLNISPSSLMMLKSKALLLLKTSVLFLILIWRWAITLPNFLAPWTSKSGPLTESDVLGFQFLP